MESTGARVVSGAEVTVIFCIVLDYTTPRAYWDTPDPVEGTPPVCMSQNSILPCLLVAFSNVIFVTTLEIGVRVLSRRVEYFRNLGLLVTGTRTSNGMMLLGRRRNSSTDSLHALALLSPSFQTVGTLSPEEAAQAKAFGQQFMEIVNAAQLVLGAEVVVRAVSAGFSIVGNDAVLAHADRRAAQLVPELAEAS